MNILVVDDEFYTCELLAEKIRSFGLREIEAVLCAGSGKEALRILEKTDCQLLITDICMSPMDGLELISKAKEIQPELICVLLSAFDEFAYAQRGIQLRIRDYWLKPVNEEEMRASLLEIIQEYQSDQHQSRALLDTIISGAVLSGDKTLEEIFQGAPGYPGNGGYFMVWEESVFQELTAPGFWVYRRLNGQSLFACPAARPSPEDKNGLLRLADQLGKPCGVSLAGGNAAELARQAKYALSLQWVWEEKKTVFYEAPEHCAEALSLVVRETLTQAMTVTESNIDQLLADIAARHGTLEEFAFAVSMDRVRQGLLKDLAGLTGKPLQGYSRPHRKQGWQSSIKALLKELIAAKSRAAGSRKRDPIQWSVSYIESHYGDADLDMTLLADKLGFSYQYYSELFHRQMGITFSEYILDFRMKEACRLLLQGELVSEIAKKTGYSHAHSFTRAFKRMYGISPGAFREMKE